ncbi:MAG: magnesium transporter CorA family protein [Clostridia bacterium]|nr:magnesium transporter CorA family protein [Clostridia bacterium]
MVKYFYTTENNGLIQLDTFKEKCWIDMINPTDVEVDAISKFTGIPEDSIKAALDEEERARTDFDDGNSLFIVDCPIIEDGDSGDVYSTLPLAIIYNDKCVLTVCLKGNTVLKNFITGREKLDTRKPVDFILRFMLGNAKRFLYCLKQIDRKSHRVQSELERTMKNEHILQLLDLENSLVYFSTSLNSNYRVHEKLSKVEVISAREEYTDLYDDVVIESRQAIEMCNIYKDILTVAMDAYGSVISNNANDTMKRLTIATILLAIPTMIAGFWGMNVFVPGQTGQGSTLWFWLVVAGTAVLTAGVALFMTKFTGAFFRNKRRNKRDKKRD